MSDNPKALVSGGSGAIGSAICLALARDGFDVAFSWHKNEERAGTLSDEIRALGGNTLCASLAATDGSGITAFCKSVEEEFGKVDVLVNNLGATQVLPFALIDEPDWDLMMNVNLKSLFFYTKAVVRGMIRRRSGVVVNLGSLAGHRLLEVPVHYATAKAAVSGFTNSLAKELSRYGIRVNEVVPGLIEGGIGSNVNERQLREYNQYCSLKRPGTPEEVADLVAFMASDKAQYINAQHFIIDGGL